jgi:hypothetical protein
MSIYKKLVKIKGKVAVYPSFYPIGLEGPQNYMNTTRFGANMFVTLHLWKNGE